MVTLIDLELSVDTFGFNFGHFALKYGQNELFTIAFSVRRFFRE